MESAESKKACARAENRSEPYSPYPEVKVKVKKRKSASHHKKKLNSPRNTAHMRQHGNLNI